jgi:glycosyltransferase involved in cell wall biosynthesis
VSGEVEISVVIPTRNRAGFLEDCLRSLAEQRCETPFEVVVVDNASDDGTQDLVRRWSAADERFRYVRQERLGRAAAMNAGIGVARGEVLIFTDDDVYVCRDLVETYRRFFAEHPDGLVFAGGTIRPVALEAEWPWWFSPRSARSLILIDWGGERPLGPGETVWGANTAAPRRVFDRLGVWHEDMGVRGDYRPPLDRPELNEDLEFEERVRAAGGEIWFVADAVVEHRTDIPGPRICLRKGFASGRNDFNRAERPGMPRDRRRGPRSLRSAAAWVCALARYLGNALAFRLRPGRRRFDRAWQAAWSSGWRMEDLLARGPHDAFDRRVRRITRVATQRAASLVPRDLPDEPPSRGR